MEIVKFSDCRLAQSEALSLFSRAAEKPHTGAAIRVVAGISFIQKFELVETDAIKIKQSVNLGGFVIIDEREKLRNFSCPAG